MSTTAPPSPTARIPRRLTAPARGFGPLLLRLHFYAGVFVAPFLLLAALSGLAFVFSPQIDRLVYADELIVADPGGPARPMSELMATARATHPEGAVIAIRPGTGERSTQIDFSSPALDAEHAHTVYLDQYTGAVTGQLTTWWTSTPTQTWLDDLHTSLHLGKWGHLYSEFAASWLAVLALGGLLLWWRRQRGRRMLTPDFKARRGVRRTRGFHASLGAWLTLGLLFLAATGLTWSDYAGANFGKAVDALRGSRPAVATTLTGAGLAAAGGHHGMGAAPAAPSAADPATQVDSVLKVAADNGITRSVAVTVPADSGTAWTITENKATWPLGRDSIAVDGATGKVTDRSDFADWPVMAKLTQWGIYAHMGNLFGLANQLLLAALAIGLSCVLVWGYRMWWQRRPTRADRRWTVGAAPVGRGAWQQLPPWAIVVGVPLVFAAGWFVPLLGLPLLAFLLADIVLGELRNRRNFRPAPETPVSPAPAGS
ncbi:PepSY domain-containing protein [Paractinoplanes ferrugineus]|uniref:Membrane protein n=1 Tax=Paractinoplanes ferrugineus TaxID=113564 RepID=A0A919JAP7_9ACTN|nr:PepSY domain-containing protein [Actinoplanes ferrugineus]GIE16407.1 membrane protein [Actinoplanes ferrugineus]